MYVFLHTPLLQAGGRLCVDTKLSPPANNFLPWAGCVFVPAACHVSSLQHEQAVAELYSDLSIAPPQHPVTHTAADLHAILTLCQHELDLNL